MLTIKAEIKKQEARTEVGWNVQCQATVYH